MVNGVLERVWARCECKGEGVSSILKLNSDMERGEGKRKENGDRRPCHGWPAGIAGGGTGKTAEQKREEGARGLTSH
jgi:hypothetical protein